MEKITDRIEFAADHYMETGIVFPADMSEEDKDRARTELRRIFVQGGYAVAALLCSFVDLEGWVRFRNARVGDYMNQYDDDRLKSIAGMAYHQGVADYAQYINDKLGINITCISEEDL